MNRIAAHAQDAKRGWRSKRAGERHANRNARTYSDLRATRRPSHAAEFQAAIALVCKRARVRAVLNYCSLKSNIRNATHASKIVPAWRS